MTEIEFIRARLTRYTLAEITQCAAQACDLRLGATDVREFMGGADPAKLFGDRDRAEALAFLGRMARDGFARTSGEQWFRVARPHLKAVQSMTRPAPFQRDPSTPAYTAGQPAKLRDKDAPAPRRKSVFGELKSAVLGAD